VIGGLSYLTIALIAPIALVAAPLAALLGVQRPTRRDAVTAVALVLLVGWLTAGPADGFAQLERAWLVLLTASLAVVLATGRASGFVTGSLLAVSGAGAAATVLALVTHLSWGKLVWLAQRHYGLSVAWLIHQFAGAAAAAGPAAPGTSNLIASLESSLALGVRLVSSLFPGLLLLQSIAALALAWALYHRLAERPQGEPLGRLAAFRFNDHLIWGVAVSLLVLVLPRLGWVNALGGNLLVFFGGLYVVRGTAVLMAVAAAAGIGGPLAVVAVVFVTLFLAPVAALAALALGLSDTLMDWRRRLARAGQKP
jgi:hypothetical protein